MILAFEKGLVEHLVRFDSRIKKIEFTDDFDTSYNLWPQAEYPICQIARSISEDSLWPKSFDYEDEKQVVKLFTATIRYKVRLWYEREAYAIIQMQKYRIFQERNSYVLFNYNNYPYHIGMRFSNIGIVTYKKSDNEQGAQRAIEAIFESTIPFSENEDVALIQEVKINVNGMDIKVIK